MDIALPVDKVVALFDKPENLKRWMNGLSEFEHLSGEPGMPGAKSRLVFDNKGRRLEMTETILSRNLPEDFTGTYEAKGVYNRIQNRFEAIDKNLTRYHSYNEFKFRGFINVLVWLMPAAFKKQTIKHMVAFKVFAEKEGQ